MPFLPRHLNMPPLGVASVQAFAIDELLASLGGHMAHPATASLKRWRYKCFGFQKLAGESVQPKCQGHRNKHYGLMTWQDISKTTCLLLFVHIIHKTPLTNHQNQNHSRLQRHPDQTLGPDHTVGCEERKRCSKS